MYQVELKKSAQKELKALDHETKARAVSAIDKLQNNPLPSGVRKIKGILGMYRIRVGDYRVIYKIYEQNALVSVYHIRHRKDAYK